MLSLALVRFFFQAEDGIRDFHVTGVQTCALPISPRVSRRAARRGLADARRESPADPRVQAPPRGSARSGGARVAEALATKRSARSEERRVGKECRCRWCV